MITEPRVGRRKLLAGSIGAAAGTAISTGLPAAAQAEQATTTDGAVGPVIGPDDARYPMLVTGNNQRHVASPEYIKLIRSSTDAADALREAVAAGKRVSVRSGGHCFADFVCNPEIEVILDFSELNAVGYDADRRAFFVEPGATLLNAYDTLFKRWGVTIPGGLCYSVGAGGHIAGGGYGLMSRRHGLVVDHLYAVEVVVADADGATRTIVATREPDDPHHDLWWAHTGGGGGNFGLVTRYWFRSPGASGDEPQDQLIAPPRTVLVSSLSLPWEQIDEYNFTKLMNNYGQWHERNSSPGSKYRNLGCLFVVTSQAHGALNVFIQVDATVPRARRLLDDYVHALLKDTGIEPAPMTQPSGELPALPELFEPREMPWLRATRLVGSANPTLADPTMRAGHKSGYMRKAFTATQIDALYRHMTDPETQNPNSMMVLFSFGGQVNSVAPDATANAQRSSIFKMIFQTFWPNEDDDAFYLKWLRDFYGDFFAETAGVPEPGDRMDGCYINYPDSDMADPQHNTSGIPWHELYYKGNYPRLQEVKRAYDPGNVFRHSLSIQPE